MPEQLIYKLNLPPLTEILLPGIAEELLVTTENTVHKHLNPVDLLKPEWLNFNGFKWDFVNLLYKDNVTGLIHTDGPTVWGINWIHNGTGIMDYWRHEDVVTTMDISLGHRRFRHTTESDPYLTYDMSPGAYLVNATVPHRASGANKRWAFSLRVYNQTATPWPEVINRFKDYII